MEHQSAWSTQGVLGQPGLHGKTDSKKEKEERKISVCVLLFCGFLFHNSNKMPAFGGVEAEGLVCLDLLRGVV